jgi:putative transposase
MVEPGHPELSINQQCNLLSINRSSYYYEPKPESELNLEIMLHIDKQHLKDPNYGTRRMAVFLKGKGYDVGRKLVRRLMHEMRIKALYCLPRTTRTDPTAYKYPYLLKGLEIARPNQVWMTDITYIPMSKGFMYMVAIIDVYSRYIVGWDISNTMPASWVCNVIENAIKEHGAPEILNSDQGSQFTGVDYRELLGRHNIQISMDGKGRALDNIYIERFWRTLKYEKVYLELPSEVPDLYAMLQDYILYYNTERIHSSVNNQPPKLWFTAA